jgi:hypothetical protein
MSFSRSSLQMCRSLPSKDRHIYFEIVPSFHHSPSRRARVCGCGRHFVAAAALGDVQGKDRVRLTSRNAIAVSALPPIATAKAGTPQMVMSALHPIAEMCVQLEMSALGQ